MGFPDPPYPCAPLAVVTTSAGKIVAIDDRRIGDANRARCYKNTADPGNVVRYREGWFLHPGDGLIRWWNPADDYFVKRRLAASPNLTIYPSLPVLVDVNGRTEMRSEIDSEEVVADPDAIPSETAVTLYTSFVILVQKSYTYEPVPGGTPGEQRIAGVTETSILTLGGDPFSAGGPDLQTVPGDTSADPPVKLSRLAVIRFDAILRLNSSGLRDHTAGTVLSVTDAWTTFGH